MSIISIEIYIFLTSSSFGFVGNWICHTAVGSRQHLPPATASPFHPETWSPGVTSTASSHLLQPFISGQLLRVTSKSSLPAYTSDMSDIYSHTLVHIVQSVARFQSRVPRPGPTTSSSSSSPSAWMRVSGIQRVCPVTLFTFAIAIAPYLCPPAGGRWEGGL